MEIEATPRHRAKRKSIVSIDGCVILCPTDPKYKKYEEIHPDKLEIWDETRPGHLQENMWSLGDAVHLKEVTTMREILSTVQSRGPIPDWVCSSILVWWKHHHSDWVLKREDVFRNYWIPLCETRFHYPEILKDTSKKYVTIMHNISTVIEQLTVDDDLKDLLRLWRSYEKRVKAYKAYNANIGILLYHAYFSPKDDEKNVKGGYKYVSMYESIRGSCDANRKSSGYVSGVIHFLGENVFRNVLLKREKFPDFMWDAVFSKQYQQFRNNILVHLDALSSGNAPIVLEEADEEAFFAVNLEYLLNLNPLAPEYQKDERFPPNRLDEWSVEIENEIRTLALNAQRNDMKAIRKALVMVKRRGALEEWELLSIRKCFSEHYTVVNSFYTFTSQVHIPLLETRICLPQIMKDSLDDYIKDIQIIRDLVASLKVGDDIQILVKAWYSYEEKFCFAMQIHDPMYIILYHTYFSREEHLAHLHKYLKKGVYDAFAGSMIYHAGKDKFRRVVLKNDQLSDLTWHLRFGSKYDRYIRDAVMQIEALESGVPADIGNGAVSKLFSFLKTNLSEECLHSNESNVPGTAQKINPPRTALRIEQCGKNEINEREERLSGLINSFYSGHGKR